MKGVGIIGGLGPQTTAEFYIKIMLGVNEANKDNRPLVVFSSVPMQTQHERDAIVQNKNVEVFIEYITTEAIRLEKSGVDFIVMPCNSLHCFIDELRSSVGIPVLSIVEETIKLIKEKRYKKIGIVSTLITLEKKVYETKLSEQGIDFINPNKTQQTKLGKIVERLVFGNSANNDGKVLLSIIDNLKEQGAEVVILACTDLQLLVPKKERKNIYDTMEIFANATVKNIVT